MQMARWSFRRDWLLREPCPSARTSTFIKRTSDIPLCWEPIWRHALPTPRSTKNRRWATTTPPASTPRPPVSCKRRHRKRCANILQIDAIDRLALTLYIGGISHASFATLSHFALAGGLRRRRWRRQHSTGIDQGSFRRQQLHFCARGTGPAIQRGQREGP